MPPPNELEKHWQRRKRYYRDGSDSATISLTLNGSQEVVSGQRYIEGIDGDLAAIRSIDIGEETDETFMGGLRVVRERLIASRSNTGDR